MGGPVPVSNPGSFAQLGLSDAVLRAVYEVGYETPSPIQAAAIGPLLEGRDLLGQAQTGTGKTAAFALPLLSRLDVARVQPQILVLTPTRELAIQVAEAFQTYARYLPGFHVLPVYGGQSLGTQLRPLRRGVHVVVGTPGRILDHLRRATLVLDALSSVVLDEADEMLRMGFVDDVERILEQTPAHKQLALFSATMPDAILAIARRHTRDLVEIRSESRTATVATVSQRYWQVSGVHKLDALTRILEVEDFDAMLIFVRTKIATAELAQRLEARGFSCAALNGDMNQAARELTIERLKSGRLDVLVATDVAARGLHVERISHVVNYDIPYDTEAYVHRIGRTARAGRKGEAILFVAPRERRMLRAIEHATGQTITPMNLPSQEDIADKRASRFKEAISEVIATQDLSVFRAVIRSYQDEQGVELGEIAAALACMAQGGRPLLAPARADERAAAASAPVSAPRQDAIEPASEPPRARTDAPRAPRRARADDEAAPRPGCVRYRLEVGSQHGVQAKNIVGAIANEAGLDSEHIGPISIGEEFSTVDLPDGMPKDLFKHLRQVWVCGRRLKLSVLAKAQDTGAPQGSGAGPHTPRERVPGSESRPGKRPDRGPDKRHGKSKDKGKRKDKNKGKPARDKPGPARASGT